jgi:phosphoenolpyruvate carboxylase
LTYFHLANVTEQVHRARVLRRIRGRDGGWLHRTAKLIADRGVPARDVTAAASRLAIRPVFTAHPTEAARRTILTKLRAIATELEAEAIAEDHDGWTRSSNAPWNHGRSASTPAANPSSSAPHPG